MVWGSGYETRNAPPESGGGPGGRPQRGGGGRRRREEEDDGEGGRSAQEIREETRYRGGGVNLGDILRQALDDD